MGSSVSSVFVSVGAATNLLTSKWSPISRFGSIEPLGILNAWTTNVRTKNAKITATQIDSKYSRTTDLRNPGPAASVMGALLGPDLQHGEKRFLRNLDTADALHALLAFLLLLQQLALARNVAAVAFGEHVLAQRLD